MNIKEICDDHILKVIIETCLLNDEEKKKLDDMIKEKGEK